MLKTSMLMLVALSLGACAPTPLTQEENEQAVIHSVGLEACYRKGWIQNPSVAVEYGSFLQTMMANRGNPTSIAQYRKKWQGAVSALKPEDCRQLEMYALQHVQREAKQEKASQEFDEAMDGLHQTADQIRASTPTMTMCQRGGAMVMCNSF